MHRKHFLAFWEPAAVSLTRIFLVGLMISGICLSQDQPAATPAADSAGPGFTDQQLEFFETKVRPILVEHCFECHGPEAAPLEGGLSLASRTSLMTGGDTGAGMVPGAPDDSLIIQAIRYDGVYEMPPDTKLSDEKIGILTEWVKQGAAWPRTANDEVAAREEFNLEQRKQEHWAWQPILDPPPPNVEDSTWPANSIDHFILHRLEQAQLKPAVPAGKSLLIRRAYFDLIGLPPTREQVQAFLDDSSPNAFETVVDQLLASPHYGERWTRHWMDLVRYAETYGHEFDYPIPNTHPYRDYLIRAFNEDVSYKQMIQEHIAGDLLEPRRNRDHGFNESKLATGFWYFGEAKHGAVDSRGEEAATIDNQIDVMSKTFLGLTVACARCHDHKFDAISTADYYALAGFLQSSRREHMMLDPDRKIESIMMQTSKKMGPYQKAIEAFSQQVATANAAAVARYLKAAMEVVPKIRESETATILQGEKLKQSKAPEGVSEIQTIAANGKFRWQDDRQYWWRDGEVGQIWELEFDVPPSANSAAETPGEVAYQVKAQMTRASDYGAAEIAIDGQVVAERADFYAPQLSVEGIELGSVTLVPGKHRLQFRLLEPNPDAIKRNMVGIDSLILQPAQTRATPTNQLLAAAAANQQVDAAVLTQLVESIRSPAAMEDGHPMHWLRAASDTADWKTLAKVEKGLQDRTDAFFQNSEVFASFDDGLPAGWTQTGVAFQDGQTDAVRASVGQAVLQSPGTISSGRLGKSFYGVLRSPDFELKHGRIHYRLKGHNVSVRLIVNGFFMDEYNALLFNECKVDLPQYDALTWHTQAGDVKNHIGNQAYLEIIDHGGGYVELDEIRFSDDASPPSQCSLFSGANSGDELCEAISRQLVQALSDSSQPAHAPVLNWLLETNLSGLLFDSPVVGQSSPSAESLRSVSLVRSAGTQPREAAARLREDVVNAQQALQQLSGLSPAPMLALGMTDGAATNEHVFVRGNHKSLGPVVPRRFLSALSKAPIDPPDSSGRLQLARKITAPNNPLTARVAVNRIWQHLMGAGIVESVDNFGVLGKAPTHPELLDHLAVTFSKNDWSIKQMIKTIMLSKTYQMSSSFNPAATEIDPDNELLHRARIKRLEGEAIRDAILSVESSLDETMYGKSVPIHLTPFMSGRGRPGSSGPLDGDGRRSLYIEVRRNFLSPMMLAFDTPIPFNTTGRRNESNVPAQALILMNSPFVVEQAGKWAQHLVAADETMDQRITTVYQAAFARMPSPEEIKSATEFLDAQATELGIDEPDRMGNVGLWSDFCHVIFNVKEFIFIQ